MDRQSELIESLAKKYNTTKAEIEHIYKQQFWYVHSIMQSGEHKGVKLPYFGKFVVKAKRQLMADKEEARIKKLIEEKDLYNNYNANRI